MSAAVLAGFAGRAILKNVIGEVARKNTSSQIANRLLF